MRSPARLTVRRFSSTTAPSHCSRHFSEYKAPFVLRSPPHCVPPPPHCTLPLLPINPTLRPRLAGGQFALLENTRFHKGEEANDEAFARALIDSTGASVFVLDAFGAAHRAHASVSGVVPHVEKALPGLLMRREIEALTSVMWAPQRPFCCVVGGAKVADKIGVLKVRRDESVPATVARSLGRCRVLGSGHVLSTADVRLGLLPRCKGACSCTCVIGGVVVCRVTCPWRCTPLEPWEKLAVLLVLCLLIILV